MSKTATQPSLEFPGLTHRASALKPAPVQYEMVIDGFAGAGGASLGIEHGLGHCVDVAMNHNPLAVQIHEANHPHTRHFCQNILKIDPFEACGDRPVGLAWFSPDCKHFSRAKGGKPVSKKIRGLAWVVVDWAAKVKPRIIMLENVVEFETWGPLHRSGPRKNQPILSKKGQTFLKWWRAIEKLGYVIEKKRIVAADFGAPTIRERLFLIMRNDGEPIVWPAATHAKRAVAAEMNLLPYVPAYTCIDWKIPTKSIFGRKRPHVENTQRRIAKGIQKFVFEKEDPFFLVTCNHAGEGFRGRGLDQPLMTLTGARDAHGLVMPTLLPIGYGEAPGQQPRTADIQAPLATVVGSRKHALVQAWLLKYNVGQVALPMTEPLPTQMTRPHDAACAVFLTKFYGTAVGQDVRDPLPTTTGQGLHVGEVRAFLIKYFGTGENVCTLDDPMSTVTSKHRLGLVTVCGQDYQIVDIGLRMLVPVELLRGQMGKYAADYILIGTESQQIAGIGNSVCPEVAEALVRANVQLRLVTKLGEAA